MIETASELERRPSIYVLPGSEFDLTVVDLAFPVRSSSTDTNIFGDEVIILCSYVDALDYSSDKQYGPKRITSAWRYLSVCALYDESSGIDEAMLRPEAVKTYLFEPDFVIAVATRVSGALRVPRTSFRRFSRVSASFLVDFANNGLYADPSIPKVLV